MDPNFSKQRIFFHGSETWKGPKSRRPPSLTSHNEEKFSRSLWKQTFVCIVALQYPFATPKVPIKLSQRGSFNKITIVAIALKLPNVD